MGVGDTALGKAFLDDHRHLTRGLYRLLQALEADDLSRAVQLAGQVDRLAGAHIQFEEEVLYPEVAKLQGDQFVARLHQEHDAGRATIEALLQPSAAPLTEGRRSELLEMARTAHRHAESCGTLLSHLTSLPAERQGPILERLEAIRAAAPRWSELPPRRPDEAGSPSPNQ